MKDTLRVIKPFAAVTLVYLLLVLFLPANKASMHEYHLSAMQYHVLIFLIVLPIVVVWFSAFYGYAQIKAYADKISDTEEGKGFTQLARGFKWLAWGFPIPAILKIIMNSIVNDHVGFKGADIIIDSYVTLLVSLIAFTIISNGARGLTNTKQFFISQRTIRWLVACFVAIGVTYCFLTFRQLDIHHLTSTNNPFYLPSWLMVSSITIPFLYTWFIGILAAYEIIMYGRRSSGILYRRPTRTLALGVALIIVGSIALQYVTSVVPRSAHFSLNGMLLTTYVIRFIAGIGYFILVVAANRLRKIEEV
jgi:hypothetical protein